MPKALIIGVSGQAGSYLAEYLLSLGYEVDGTYCTNHPSVKGVRNYHLDLASAYDISQVLQSSMPSEIYNMAALMFAPASWDDPILYSKVNGLAVGVILQKLCSFGLYNTRYFQAGSAEVFEPSSVPITELSVRRPRTPYGVAKVMAEETVRIYRERKNLFACTGIFFNMESPRRPLSFFSTKVAAGVAAIRQGRASKLDLGDLSAIRDWGLASEYVVACHKMLRANVPNDYIIATGESHTCLRFVEKAFEVAGLPMNEHLTCMLTGKSKDYFWADPQKIRDELGWSAKSKFNEVVTTLVEAYLEETVWQK